MKKQITLLLTAMVLVAAGAFAQGRKSLRINEVMVQNESSVVDEYGQHGAWIELFNTNFAPLEISSVYLTTDKNNPRMYPVPLGDAKTRIGKRQRIIFWADNDHTKGTFHTNFTLVPGRDNWIGIYDADGVTLIDEVVVPASLSADQSYARTPDGDGEWQVRTGDTAEGRDMYITPGDANTIRATNSKIEMFAEQDENGFAMTLMAMGIVFCALLILCLCFYGIGEISKFFSRLNKARATGTSVKEYTRDDHDSGEEIAAVVMALHEHLNVHDNESNMLTIKKMRRAYSPWSSKIYTLREIPSVHHNHR